MGPAITIITAIIRLIAPLVAAIVRATPHSCCPAAAPAPCRSPPLLTDLSRRRSAPGRRNRNPTRQDLPRSAETGPSIGAGAPAHGLPERFESCPVLLYPGLLL